MSFVSLPIDIIKEIISFLSYSEQAEIRKTCKIINSLPYSFDILSSEPDYKEISHFLFTTRKLNIENIMYTFYYNGKGRRLYMDNKKIFIIKYVNAKHGYVSYPFKSLKHLESYLDTYHIGFFNELKPILDGFNSDYQSYQLCFRILKQRFERHNIFSHDSIKDVFLRIFKKIVVKYMGKNPKYSVNERYGFENMQNMFSEEAKTRFIIMTNMIDFSETLTKNDFIFN